MESGRMRRAGYSLLLASTVLSAGCTLLPQHENRTEEYCLSAGQGQAFDCARPADEPSAGPLRIRSLPIDDETLEARVAEIKRWLAAERVRLSTDPSAPAAAPEQLIPPPPDAPAGQEPLGSDAEETLIAAQALAERGEIEAGLELLQQYRQLQPDDLSAILLSSRLLLLANRYEEAERLLNTALENHPRVAEIYNNLAVIQARQGRLGAAIDTLQQAFSTDPSFDRIQRNLKALYAVSARNALTPDLPPLQPKLEMIEQLPTP